MPDILPATLLHVALTKSAPLTLAAIGGLLSERAGVVNVGLEGAMLAGAYAAAVGSLATGNPWSGLLIGGAAGAALGLLHAFACIRLRSDHILSGVAVNLLALGGTGFLLFRAFGVHGNTPTVPKLPPWSIPGLNALPVFGPALRVPPTVCLALAAAAVAHLVLYRTAWGLRLRAVGEHPGAALSAGVRVRRIQYVGVTLAGLLAGWGGAHLSLGDLSQFVERMTAGRGFVALAALICGRWNPLGTLTACLSFGFAEAFAEGLQTEGSALPSQFFLALPFILTLGVLAGFAGKARPPGALGRRVGEEGMSP